MNSQPPAPSKDPKNWPKPGPKTATTGPKPLVLPRKPASPKEEAPLGELSEISAALIASA